MPIHKSPEEAPGCPICKLVNEHLAAVPTEMLQEELERRGPLKDKESILPCAKCGKDLWGRGMVYQVRMGSFEFDGYGDREFSPEEEVGFYCGDCLQKGV